MENNVALVFGASGISGWALTKNLLSYPTAMTFSRIIGLTNRVMDVENSQLPIEDPRLEFYSGINLRGDLSSVIDQLKATVPRLEEVTHMYYCGQSYENMESSRLYDPADNRFDMHSVLQRHRVF